MTKPKAKSEPARRQNFYGNVFTEEELALVAAFVQDPSLDDELWLQRVLNRRLAANVSQEAKLGDLIKVVEVLAIGTGRVARLLRDKRALSGEAADGIAGAIAAALDELTRELGIDL